MGVARWACSSASRRARCRSAWRSTRPARGSRRTGGRNRHGSRGHGTRRRRRRRCTRWSRRGSRCALCRSLCRRTRRRRSSGRTRGRTRHRGRSRLWRGRSRHARGTGHDTRHAGHVQHGADLQTARVVLRERSGIGVEQRLPDVGQQIFVVRLREIDGDVVQGLPRTDRILADDRCGRLRCGRSRCGRRRGRRTALRAGDAAQRKENRRHGDACCPPPHGCGNRIKSNDHQVPWHTARAVVDESDTDTSLQEITDTRDRNKKAPRLARRFSSSLRVISRVV